MKGKTYLGGNAKKGLKFCFILQYKTIITPNPALKVAK